MYLFALYKPRNVVKRRARHTRSPMNPTPAPDIRIEPVRSKRDLRLFLETPLNLHKDEPFWAPLPTFLEKEQLDRSANPFWKHADRELFLAFRGERAVGRIAAVIDHDLDAVTGERVGVWGYFACEDDPAVATALFRAAEDWHNARPEGRAAFLRGPLNPSLNYAAGMLVEGFERFPSFMNPYNPPYYPPLVEACGMEKEQDLFYYRFCRAANFDICNQELGKNFARGAEHYTLRRSTRATYDEDMRLLADLFTRCWADNWGFTPMHAEEIRHSWAVMRWLPAPSELTFLEYKGEAVGMSLYGADLGRLFKRLNGRISLSAPWHLFAGLRAVDGVRLYMLGVTKKHRRGLAIFRLLLGTINAAADTAALDYVDAGWVLEDNVNMNQICERLKGERLTRSRIYRRECGRV